MEQNPNKAKNLHSIDERLLPGLLDSLPVAVMICDLEGVNVRVNQKTVDMTGYSIEELLRGVWMITPDDTDAAVLFEHALRDGTPGHNYETRLVRKDGREIWVSISWNPVLDDKGDRVGLSTVFVDITDQKRAEEALGHADSRYQELSAKASDFFWELDMDGTITHVSESVRQIGWEPQDWIGHSALDFLAPDEHAAFLARTDRARRGDASSVHELRIRRKDGTYAWLEVTRDVVIVDGKPVRVHGVAREVTSRREAQQALHDVTERYRMMTENSADMFWEMDLRGNFIYVSPAARNFGYEPQEWIGHNLTEFLAPDEVPTFAARLETNLRNPEPRLYEVRMLDKQGKDVWVEVMINHVFEAGKLTKIHGVARNITERKNAEAELTGLNERYRRMAEGTTDIFWETGPDGYFTYISPAIRRFGYEPEEWVGHIFSEFVAPDQLSQFNEALERGSRDPQPALYEFRVLGKDGRDIWIEVMVNHIIEDGKSVARHGIARDITERKMAEEDYRRVNERYRVMTENSADVLWEIDLDKTFTYVSPAVRNFGYEPEDWIGHRIAEFLVPEEVPASARRLEEDQRDPKPRLFETCLLDKDRKEVWVEVMVNQVVSDGKLVSRHGIARNITQRKAAEKALAESEQRYKSIVENSSDLIMLQKPDGTFIYSSPAQLALTGRDPDEVVGTDLWPVHQDDYKMARDVFDSAAMGSSGRDFEYRVIDTSGRVKWVSHSWAPIMDGEQVSMIVSVVRDVTERKKAQDDLRESEEKFRSVYETANALILGHDLQWQVIYMNPYACKVLGYEEGEMIGKDIRTMLERGELDRAEPVRQAVSIAPDTHVEGFEQYYLKKGGGRVLLSWNVAALRDSDGKAVGILGVAQDITERKMNEEALREAHAELEKAYALQQQFLNSVTHEVRTPLTTIKGYAEMLMEGVMGPVSEEQAKLLKKVLASSQHMIELVTGVLQVARTRSGRIALHPAVFDPIQAVEKAVAEVAPQALEKGLAIGVDPKSNGRLGTYDQQALTMILTNLLSNAVKFSETGPIEVMVTCSAPGAEIIIADKGMGIRESDIASIFDEFSQLEYPGKYKPVGFGIGLAIVAVIVDTIGASLIVSSEKGTGTAFTLWVPVLDA